MQFIHIVLVEILCLTVYLYHLEQNNNIFIPSFIQVLEMPAFFSEPPISISLPEN